MLRKILHGESLFRFINICIFHKYLIIMPFPYIYIVLSLSFLLSFQDSYSQGFHTTSNKALRLYKDGMSAYDYFDFNTAEALFKEAVSIDKNFFESYMMLGEINAKNRNYSEAAKNYRKAVKTDSLFYKPVFFSLANSEMMSGDYINALIHFKVYLAQQGMQEKNKEIASKNIKNCEFAINAMKNPVSFDPVNVGNAINSTDDEYWPSITADGQTIMFTRQNSNNKDISHFNSNPSQEDFYLSYYSNNTWTKSVNAGAPLNTQYNEGAQTISSDGRYMYFTACDRPGGIGSCDIYFSLNNNGNWTEAVNLRSPVNTSYWESQPSISSDGNLLFFSSNRPGGFGGKDIWYSKADSNNKWMAPVNLGSIINTAGDEMSPFIHFDGRTLYFASDGRIGMGGYDIYMSRMNDDSTWSEPQNLGYPINTYNDETGLIIESGGQKAYFSSIRDKTNGKDIFCFNLYDSIKPNPVSYLKGKVYDKETGKLLVANYELIDLQTGKVTVKNSTDGYGNFLVCLPSGCNYGINVKKDGYLFYSESFMFDGIHTLVQPFIKRINLDPIKIGEKMLLSNVFYEFDSWKLKNESMAELNNLAELLLKNKNLSVEIGGYTDATGTKDYNLTLSEKRAVSVVNYLISKGVASSRLKYKGYGNAFPIADNLDSEGRKLNRRTEAKIIDYTK
jgi:tetratricopeptide (TPR) repeat protein